MLFAKRKLPSEAAAELNPHPVHTVSAHRPVVAPHYVFLRLNHKFVSVKEPLDFFTPADLERLKSYELFFTPRTMESVYPYQDVGRAVKRLIAWQPDESEPTRLPPAPFELSDAILRVLAPMWGAHARLEPFFVIAFAEEICAPLDGALLSSAREADVERYESALTCAAWAVYLALHLGHCDPTFLSALRSQVFREANGMPVEGVVQPAVQELIGAARAQTGGAAARPVAVSQLTAQGDAVILRITGRLRRVQEELNASGNVLAATVHGPEGFVSEGSADV